MDGACQVEILWAGDAESEKKVAEALSTIVRPTTPGAYTYSMSVPTSQLSEAIASIADAGGTMLSVRFMDAEIIH